MFKATFISDALISTKLCESTRSLAEHNLKLNGVNVVQVEDLFRAEFKLGFYRKNKRNQLSFDVSRSQDFSGVEFASPEAAFIWALDHIGSQSESGGPTGTTDMGGSGTLKIEVTSVVFNATRYMHNCLLESSQFSDASLGICLGLSYSFTGGVINSTP